MSQDIHQTSLFDINKSGHGPANFFQGFERNSINTEANTIGSLDSEFW